MMNLTRYYNIILVFSSYFVFDFSSSQNANITIVSYGLTPPTILSSLPLVAPGFDMGIERMESLYGYNIFHTYLSPKSAVTCADLADHISMISSYYYTRHNETTALAFILPGCDDLVPLGMLAREWNTLMLSSGLSYADLRNRAKYPTSINNGPMQLAMFGEVFVSVFRQFSWTSVAVLLDTGAMAPFFKLWPNALTDFVARTLDYKVILHLNNFNSLSTLTNYKALLNEAQRVSRVIILSSIPKIVRKFMITASSLNMTNGEHVYFAVEPLRSNRYFGNLTWQYYDVDDQVAMEAYRSLMQIAPCYNERLESNTDFLDELTRRANDTYGFQFPQGELPSAFSFAAYESMEMFGQVADDALRSSRSLTDGAFLARQFLNRTFHLRFEDAYIDERGERRSNYCVSALDVQSKLFRAVLYYDARTKLLSNLSDFIDWANGNHAPPLNEPRCGYLGNNPACLVDNNAQTVRLIIGLSIGVVLVTAITVSIVGLVIRKTKQNSFELYNEWWKINSDEVKFVHGNRRTKSAVAANLRYIRLSSSKPEDVESAILSLSDIQTAVYDGVIVWITYMQLIKAKTLKFPNQEALWILREVKRLQHVNINRMIGICIEPDRFLIVSEFCQKNSLRDVIQSMELDLELKYSFFGDIMQGLCEIHKSTLKYHGDIRMESCLISSKFSLKIGNLAFGRVIKGVAHWKYETTEYGNPSSGHCMQKSTVHGFRGKDVTNLGKIGHELFELKQVMSCNGFELKDVGLLKPLVPSIGINPVVITIVEDCLKNGGLTIHDVEKMYQNSFGKRNVDIIAKLQRRLEKYAETLEDLVRDRTTSLLVEQQACDLLLGELLPPAIVEQLRKGHRVEPALYDAATIYFSSIYGFQDFVLKNLPETTAQLLTKVYLVFDTVLVPFDVFKMETIADTYLVVSGIPKANGDKHASEVCRMAIQIRTAFVPFTTDYGLQLRAGIHTGPCAGGVVGFKSPRFCLFGDTVNTCSRMESHGLPSRIHLSSETANVISTDQSFCLSERGSVQIKGKGECVTFWLESKGLV